MFGFAKTPLLYRRPYYNNFTYPGYPDHTNIQADLPTPGPAPRLVPGVLQCCSTDQSNYLGNDASSKYDALQIKFEKRFHMVCKYSRTIPLPTHISTTMRIMLTTQLSPMGQMIRSGIRSGSTMWFMNCPSERKAVCRQFRPSRRLNDWRLADHRNYYVGQRPARGRRVRTSAAARKMLEFAGRIRAQVRSRSVPDRFSTLRMLRPSFNSLRL